MSEYEDVIFEMIKCFKKWGLWEESAAFYCCGKKYAACDFGESGNGFRGLKCVNVTEYTDEEKKIVYRPRYGNKGEYEEIPYDFYLEYGPRMVDLYDFGFYTTTIRELECEKQYKIVERRPELMEPFEEEIEDMINNQDWYPEMPNILEFDSADEFIEFRDDYIDEMRNKYIKELTTEVTLDNDAEAEICSILLDAGFCYDDEGGGMFIGRDERLMG